MTVNDFAADTLFGAITLANTADGQDFTLSGNRIILGGNITTTQGETSASITDTISLDLVLNANRSMNVNLRHALVISGDITQSGGTFSLSKANGGVLTLSGNNSFSGGLLINNGTVVASTVSMIGNSSSIGSGGIIRFGNGTSSGALHIVGAGGTTDRLVQIGNANAVTDVGGAEIRNDGAGTVVFSNAIFNQQNATATAGRKLTLRGVSTAANEIVGVIRDNSASGAISVEKLDAGLWILSGNNTYSGGTTIQNGGTLQAGHSNALGTGAVSMQGNGTTLRLGNGVVIGNALTVSDVGTVKNIVLATGAAAAEYAGTIDNQEATAANFKLVAGGGGILTVSGAISGAGGVNVERVAEGSGGTVILSGNNSYALATTVGVETILRVTHGSALGSTDAGTTVVNGGALELSGGIAIGAEAITINGLGIGGGGALRNVSGSNSIAGLVSVAAPAADNKISSDSGVLTLSGGVSAVGAANRDVVFDGAGAIVVSGTVGSGGAAILRNVIKNGAGSLTFSGANNYGGTTTVNAGTINLNHASALGGGNVTFLEGAILDNTSGSAVVLSTANAWTLSGDGIDALIFGGSNDLDLGGGTFSLQNNLNKYITLNGGSTLALGTVTSVRNVNTTLHILQGSGSGARLTMDGLQINLNSSPSGSKTFSINTDVTVEIEGAVSDGNPAYANNLDKSGSGALILHGAADYTGFTRVSGGTLRLGVSDALSAGGQLLISDGLLDLDGHDQTVSVTANLNLGGVAGGTPVIATGGGTLTLASGQGGTITYNAANNPNGAVIGGKLHLAPGNNPDGAQNFLLNIGDSAATDAELTISAVISKTGASGIFYAVGGGTLVLTGANTFDMNPQIRSATMVLGYNDYADGTTAGALGVRNTNVTVGHGAQTVGSAALLLMEGIESWRAISIVDHPDATAAETRALGGVNTAGTAIFHGNVTMNNVNAGAGITLLTAAAGGTVEFKGLISDGANTIGIEKIGGGTVILSGNNSYKGATTVKAGTLIVNGIHTAPGLITVEGGATLGGSGVIGDIKVESTGILAPGNSIGELEGGSLTLDGGSMLKWDLHDNGVDADLLTLSGGLLKGTGTGWTFDFLGTGAIGTYTLIKYGSSEFSTGDFSFTGLKDGYSAPDGVVVNTSLNEVQLTVIPEPASLGALGILVLAGLLRRRLRR